MTDAGSVFRFILDASARGERTALVTITGVTGSSSRAPGTQMAVSETGAIHGSLSGGCVEAAVVGEAQRVIGTGAREHIRLGPGSPYIDIQLPCGGGLDLLILPDPPAEVIARAVRFLEGRIPVLVSFASD